MIIHNIDQGTSEWFELRAGRVTGTRFKTIMMGKSTKGYSDLVAEMTAEIVTGGVTDQDFSFTSAIMERGKELEPVARNEFIELTGLDVEERGFITPDEEDEFYEWIGISPDGILELSFDHLPTIVKGLEIKCPLAKTHLSYLEGGILPKEYEHQVQGSLFTTNADSWFFMSYYPGMKPFVIEVIPDRKLHNEYEERLRELITEVKEKINRYNSFDINF